MGGFRIPQAAAAIKLITKVAEGKTVAPERQQREIDERLYFDRSNPERVAPILPPGASYDANLMEAWKHVDDPLPLKLWWFYNMVKPGGEWDYKTRRAPTPERQIEYGRAGNYNFGLTGTAARIPPWLLHRGAGFAQMATPNWKPSFGTPLDKSGSMGDDPWDRLWVDRGIDEQQRRGKWWD